MGFLAKIAVVVLVISFVVFVLFFGRIPALRYNKPHLVQTIYKELILKGALLLGRYIVYYGFIFLVSCLLWING
jgi:hypothetical protein